MADTLILEYGNRAARHHEVKRFNQSEVTIGRGFDNDLIMSQTYIGENQFKLSHTEQGWRLNVIDDTNTIRLNGRKLKQQQTILQDEDRITIGQIEFRIHNYPKQIAPTRELEWTSRLESHVLPLLATGMLLLVGLETMFSEYIYQLGELKWRPLFNESLLIMGFTVVWAGFFALLGRVFKHEAHYAAQVLFTSFFLFILAIGDSLLAYFIFYSNTKSLLFFWTWILNPIIISFLIYLHFKYATMLKRPFIWAAILTYGLAAGLYSLDQGNSDDFSPSLNYEPLIKAPFLPPFSSTNPEGFIEIQEEIFDDIAEEIEEYKKENPES